MWRPLSANGYRSFRLPNSTRHGGHRGGQAVRLEEPVPGYAVHRSVAYQLLWGLALSATIPLDGKANLDHIPPGNASMRVGGNWKVKEIFLD
jgi:hypothetical protein